ncbi:MAG: hypothetical protein WCL50_03100 [Spirochaetota bacterium]
MWSNYWWVAAFALLAFVALLRSRQARRDLRDLPAARADASPAAAAPLPDAADLQLVAVIAAAVAASSGLSTSQFRITQIKASGGAGAFNTPPLGARRALHLVPERSLTPEENESETIRHHRQWSEL